MDPTCDARDMTNPVWKGRQPALTLTLTLTLTLPARVVVYLLLALLVTFMLALVRVSHPFIALRLSMTLLPLTMTY